MATVETLAHPSAASPVIQPPQTLPPGLDQLKLENGFDATAWSFCYNPIFSLTYADAGSVAIDGVYYDVPDGMAAEAVDHAHATTASGFRGIKTVDQQSFSESVEASVGGAGDSVSVAQSLATSSNVTTDDTQTTTLISYFQHAAYLHRTTPGPVTAPFSAAVQALPPTYVPGDPSGQYAAFFAQWGTHFLATAHLGGIWTMSTMIDRETYDKLTSQTVTASVETSFDAGVTQASAKTSISDSTSSELGLTSSNSEIGWDCTGGDPGTDVGPWLQSVTGDKIAFLNDVTSLTAEEIRPSYVPIWTLLSGPAQATVKAAWQEYLALDRHPDQSFAPPIPALLNVDYQAATDGFLSLTMVTTEDGAGWEVWAVTDGKASPSTQIASASVHTWKSDEITHASLFTPIRAGDYYGLTYSQRWGDFGGTASFQPFPMALGAWDTRPLDTELSEPGDGFIVGQIYYNGDQNRGALQGSLDLGNGAQICAGASVHWDGGANIDISTNSFCMPVPANTKYRIDLVETYGNVSATAHWIPLGPSHRLLPPAPIGLGIANEAGTDGFLFGLVTASYGGDPFLPPSQAILSLQIASTGDFAQSATVATAVAEYGRGLAFCNGVTAIVPKGSWCRGVYAQTFGTTGASLLWIGIAPVTPG